MGPWERVASLWPVNWAKGEVTGRGQARCAARRRYQGLPEVRDWRYANVVEDFLVGLRTLWVSGTGRAVND